jgi:TP901-1 family phage major tail protein
MATILGKKLMLFVKNSESETYTTIAYATNHTFTTSASTVSVASKDDADVSGAGKWDAQELDMFSWSISAENLYAYEGNGITSDNVVDMYLAGKLLDVKFGLASDSTTGAPENGWTESSTNKKMLSGQAYITSLDINASNDGRASMSITLTGKGPVIHA